MKKSIIVIILVSILLNLLPVKAYADGGPEISSEAAILMNMNTGDILYQKNADEKLSPASTT
ncbi:MAG TPA: D-alanyl-D-alanine carboxypeptidase, partial [Clostridiaceae bacterium]|nr:D-alanyl-D-alanine carboxypeptidase [Clostridiaceae bacterium]